MIIGIGTDLIDIGRIAKSIEKKHFLKRVFTEAEQARIAERGADTAAGYFAAKEAVAKALGTGFDGFFTQAIEITVDERGKPECALTGGALERFRQLDGGKVFLSISHADGFAMAFCVLESFG